MKPDKKTLTGLLVAACILSGIILGATPKKVLKTVRTESQLDSLLSQTLLDAGIPKSAIRIRQVEIDSSFTRKEFLIKVPPAFSKTSFHLNLHHALVDFDLDCPARVVFPEHDMNIYILNRDTIYRTIRLISTQAKADE